MRIKNHLKHVAYASSLVACALVAQTASADMGIGLRAGTYGLGADFNVGLSDNFSARLGYNYLSLDHEIEDEDGGVTYEGTIDISSVSGFLDWYPGGGGFRLTLGAVASGPKVAVDGTPGPGEKIEIDDVPYGPTEIGSLHGEIKYGSSLAPYVGLGYGNVVGKNHRVTFLFDLGATYAGEPDVVLTAVCGPALSASQCNELQRDINDEAQDLKEEAKSAQWWPVISLGIGVRF